MIRSALRSPIGEAIRSPLAFRSGGADGPLNPYPIIEYKGMIDVVDPPTFQTGNKVYIFNNPVRGVGAATNVKVFAKAAGTLRISSWSLSAGTFTRKAFQDVAIATGLNDLTISVALSDGDYVGYSSATSCLGFNTTSGGALFFTTSATNSATTATNPGTFSQHQVAIRIKCETQKSIGATSSVSALSGYDAVFFPASGQSNMNGGIGGPITTTPEYSSIGIAHYYATEPKVEDIRPAATGYLGLSGAGAESPVYGAAAMVYRSMIAENAVLESDIKTVVCVTANPLVNSPITTFNKGSARYAWLVNRATTFKSLYGYRSAAMPMMYSQGEYEASVSGVPADYKAALKQLATDYDSDMRAIFGQSKKAPLVINQVSQTYTAISYRAHGVAQWEASKESDLVIMACPFYMLTFTDALHINASGSRIMGAYMGLAAKRHFVDGQKFQPLQPSSVAIEGNDLVVTFNKSGLVFDTTTIAAQTNSGFAVDNAGGTAQTINAVAIESGNKVRITMASTPSAGWKVKYGVPATSRTPYLGACGNLRDSAGDSLSAYVSLDGLTTWPMHNWCVLFDLVA